MSHPRYVDIPLADRLARAAAAEDVHSLFSLIIRINGSMNPCLRARDAIQIRYDKTSWNHLRMYMLQQRGRQFFAPLRYCGLRELQLQ